MHAVSISLGSTNAIVAVATATSSATSETAAPIRITANSAGHRTTPVMMAFTEGEELLFGEDARVMYGRTPEVVVPYLFAFASVAQQLDTAESSLADALRGDVEDAARRHYKGHCPLQCEEGSGDNHHSDNNDNARRLGFALPHEEGESVNGSGKRQFLPAEDALVEFLNHVKRHTVDGVCGLTATATNASVREEVQQKLKILLTVVVPRHLFPQAVAVRGGKAVESGKEESSACCENGGFNESQGNSCCNKKGGNNVSKIKNNILPAQRWDAVQWVKDAVFRSHLGAVAAHVSVIFADEAALLGADAVGCHPPLSHPMAGRHFLLPVSAIAAEPRDNAAALSWPSAHVLVVDWGALGVSLTRFRLVGGCLVDDLQPAFLRACHVTPANTSEVPFLSANPCGGGDAVSLALRDRLATTFAQQQRRVLGYQSLSDFPSRAQRRLLLAAEEKKIALSSAAQVPVEIEALAEGIDLRDNVTFSRTRVDAALRGDWKVIESFEVVLREYLDLLRQDSDAVIDAVVLCGGMLQMPFVAQSLRQLFTRYTTVPNGEHRCFAHNLVIMDASSSTTICVTAQDGQSSNGGAALTAANNTIVGADELACVGGCLYSYHLARAALQNHEHTQGDRAGVEKGKKSRAKIGRRQVERAEGARRVWNALTRGDAGDDDSGCRSIEMVVLQRPIFLYTHTSVDVLLSALEEQRKRQKNLEQKIPLKIPVTTLSILFAPYTPLPARVVIPLDEKKLKPLVLYLFTESYQEDGGEQQKFQTINSDANEYSFVVPLTSEGVTLPVSQQDPEKWKQSVVCTLRALKDDNTQRGGHSDSVSVTALTEEKTVKAAEERKKTKLQLVVQLARIDVRTPEPLVLGPSDVQATVTVDIEI